jgi:hypothetical protein
MTELRYCGLKQGVNSHRVTTIGNQSSDAGGGDGWSQIASMGTDDMPTGARPYALWITGKIGDRLYAGSGLVHGRAEVVLGTTGGTKHPNYRMDVPLQEPIDADVGIPFAFLVLISATEADALFGTSIDLSTVDLCLFARSYTGGDPQTFYTEFTVSDVAWLWFDLSQIPAGHSAQYHASGGTGTPLAPSSSGMAQWDLLGPAFGNADEVWLNFASTRYQVRDHNQLAPQFQFGLSPAGTVGSKSTYLGTGDRYGYNRSPNVGGSFPIWNWVHQGGFWVEEQANSVTTFGASLQQIGGPTTVQSRWFDVRHFAVRIDTLTDLLWQHIATTDIALPEIDPLWPTWHTTLERPAPQLLTEPIVMACGMPVFVNQRAAYGTRAWESNNILAGFRETTKTESDATRGERASAMSYGRRTFQVLSPAMQWRATWLGNAVSPAPRQAVRDITVVQFHPVRDPENVTVPPGTEPAPLFIVPNSQGPDPASLPLPPLPPNSDPLELGRLERTKIEGATGYKRSWPMGAPALRVLTVGWGPLKTSQAQEVFEFLRDNLTWQYVPPRGDPVSVLTAVRPLRQQVAHDIFSITVDVAVLRWTGA